MNCKICHYEMPQAAPGIHVCTVCNNADINGTSPARIVEDHDMIRAADGDTSPLEEYLVVVYEIQLAQLRAQLTTQEEDS